MIIPDIEVQEALPTYPSRTWRLDFASGRIRGGMIDGNEAVGQAAQCALLTERFAYLYLSWDYGNEQQTLVGKDADYIRAETPRMIRAALLQDDRINDVHSFGFDGDVVTFTVDTIYGSQKIETEVTA
ncbi:DUF2634 domain-containing protein [Christensenellaceae bacterium OttesenSCG-928-M15]|nr:DUF2634 domain-containing protein [Christensenellaceae bacterium OttesenSCG-928-M15]